MRRARRLASVAVVATLAVAGLSACRSAPSVAAYIGDGKITEARVTDVYDEAQDAIEAAGPPAAGQTAAQVTRNDVARVLVSAEVLPRVAQQQGVTLPADMQLETYAQALHVPASTEFVRLFAEEYNYATALQQKVTNAPALTDDDLHQVYDALIAAGQQGTFEQFKASIAQQDTQVLQAAVAVRQQIEQVIGTMRITINPRYPSLGIPVLQIQAQNGAIHPVVVAQVGDDQSVPVTDAR